MLNRCREKECQEKDQWGATAVQQNRIIFWAKHIGTETEFPYTFWKKNQRTYRKTEKNSEEKSKLKILICKC